MGKLKDETGHKYGDLLVLYKSEKKTCGRTYWHCLCDCGNECDVDGTKLRNGHTKSCGCAKAKANHNKAINLLGQRFGKLTVIEKAETNEEGTFWMCKCDCGNVKKIKGRYLRNGDVKSCGCLYDLTGQRYGKLTVIQQLPSQNNWSQWLCQCDCGNQKRVAGRHLRDGTIISCGCDNKSKGESKIIQILQDNNISFTREHTFDSCRFEESGKLARFDFYINNEYLIEYDGIQHFKANMGWNTEEELAQTQKRDAYKNQWCKDNAIPLIRIPYTHLDKLSINDLLLNTTTWRVE